MNKLVSSVAPAFGLARDPLPSEYLEGRIIIPKKMSPRSPGKLSFRSTPWAREILNTWHPESGVRSVTLAIAVQMLKTTLMVLGMVYRMLFSPVPQMCVGGMSERFARREISEKRLHPLIDGNPFLKELKPRDPNQFRFLEMAMAYAPILVTGAGSDTNLAGSTQGIVAIDEAAKIILKDSDKAQEAHPIRLAQDRTQDFAGQDFHWMSSTPNSSGHIFWEDTEAGTYTHFFVPCPHCREYFKFELEATNGEKKFTPGELEKTIEEARPGSIYRSIVWDPSARNKDGTWSEEKIRETAHYVCPHCGGPIRDSDKPRMLEAYESKALNENAAKSNVSYRVPCFYKPNRTFADTALAFVERGDLINTGLQVLFNHQLALPWEDVDITIKDESIWDCRATGDIAYQRGIVPNVPGMLFAAADWGMTETHWGVGLLDMDENVWAIDWGIVSGLNQLLAERKQWQYARARKPGVMLRPRMGLVDSGDNANEIYKMCQQSGGFWFPSKGSEAQSGEWEMTKLKNYPGLPLYVYVDKVAKDDLYDSRIHQKKDRRFYLPSNVTADVIAGMSGQRRIDKGLHARWKKVKTDHYGDVFKLLTVLTWITSPRRRAGDAAAD